MRSFTRLPLKAVVVASLFVVLTSSTPATAGISPFVAGYSGGFTITFGTGPQGTDDLSFDGSGVALPGGVTGLEGHSTTRPRTDNPLVSDIVSDRVVLTAAGGDEVRLENSGADTLDTSVPGHTYIHGSGTFRIVGGTGRFARASGAGVFMVFAEVTGGLPGGVSGEFGLLFVGVIEKR